MINDNDDERDDPLNRLLADETDLAPTPAGMGFVPVMPLEPEPIPAATPETMICLRDCKHYMELTSMFQHGNSKNTLDHVPKQKNRFCRAIKGTDIDLTDEVVYECNEWTPLLKEEKLILLTRREQWKKEQDGASE